MLKKLIEAAKKVQTHSYSPYSGYRVGAAILTKSGNIYSGCNVENSSFGATVCAERVAIQNAISHEGNIEIVEVAVVTDATPPWPPCGMCRQVISEFAQTGTHATKIHTANHKGEIFSYEFQNLMPEAFTPEKFKK